MLRWTLELKKFQSAKLISLISKLISFDMCIYAEVFWDVEINQMEIHEFENIQQP